MDISGLTISHMHTESDGKNTGSHIPTEIHAEAQECKFTDLLKCRFAKVQIC